MSENHPTLYSTVSAHVGCCGCLTLRWVPDENAYRAACNECNATIGWARDDWSNPDDRERLGRDIGTDG